MTEEAIAWLAGVDWGSETHQVCLLDAQGAVVGERECSHGDAWPDGGSYGEAGGRRAFLRPAFKASLKRSYRRESPSPSRPRWASAFRER
jgi:hypothetical protein